MTDITEDIEWWGTLFSDIAARYKVEETSDKMLLSIPLSNHSVVECSAYQRKNPPIGMEFVDMKFSSRNFTFSFNLSRPYKDNGMTIDRLRSGGFGEGVIMFDDNQFLYYDVKMFEHGTTAEIDEDLMLLRLAFAS
jgi:hypothetical protein